MDEKNASVRPVVISVLMPHAPVLIPAVGGVRGNAARGSIRAMGEAARRVVAEAPDVVVVISPHTPRRDGMFALRAGARIWGSLAAFGAPDVTVDLPNAESLVREIAAEAEVRRVRTWRLYDDALDHGVVVPLWHLVDAGWSGPTVVVGLDGEGASANVAMGEAIAVAARVQRVRLGIVASGDMSHRLQRGAPAGYHPRAIEFDRALIACLREGTYRRLDRLNGGLRDLAAEDAVDSVEVAASAGGWDVTGHEVLSYEGPFGVGYGVAILSQPSRGHGRVGDPGVAPDGVGGDGDVSGLTLPEIARRSLEAAFRGELDVPDWVGAGMLGERHGVFVTLRDAAGELRGCIGDLTPRFANTAEETWHLARDAAFHDPRFGPLGAGEMEGLQIEVSVLDPLEEVRGMEDLDPVRYGVVMETSDGRRGALLPAIEGVETVAEQLEIVRRKAGIGPLEPAKLKRFTVRKFSDREERQKGGGV